MSEPPLPQIAEMWDLSPSTIPPNESCGLYSLPQAVMSDHEAKKIHQVSGVIVIHCEDLNGTPYHSSQNFTLNLNYESKPPQASLRISPTGSPGMTYGSF